MVFLHPSIGVGFYVLIEHHPTMEIYDLQQTMDKVMWNKSPKWDIYQTLIDGHVCPSALHR